MKLFLSVWSGVLVSSTPSNSQPIPPYLKEGFQKMIETKRFPHALLIHGPKGIGKKNLAFSLAASLLCGEDKILDGCSCPDCKRVFELNHPDFKFMEEGDESIIKVAFIRELIAWARFHPYEGERKILVIEAVSRMNEAALNAFLKLLEEPPDSTSIILLTENPSELKQTILSRCFQISMRSLSSADIKTGLVERGVSEDEAHYVSLASKGIWQRAEELLEEGVYAADNSKLELLLSRYSDEMAQEILGPKAISKTTEKKRDEVRSFLKVAQIFLRDVLLYKGSGASAESSLFFKNRADWIVEKAAQETPAALQSRLIKLEEIGRNLAHYANPKLALMSVSEQVGEPLLQIQ